MGTMHVRGPAVCLLPKIPFQPATHAQQCRRASSRTSSRADQQQPVIAIETDRQLAKYLRPLVRCVHPDYFGRFPVERLVNEKSLKSALSHCAKLIRQKHAELPPLNHAPLPLTFYFKRAEHAAETIRNPYADKRSAVLVDSAELKIRQFSLESNSVVGAVVELLRKCDLSTQHLPPQMVAQAAATAVSRSRSAVSPRRYANENVSAENSSDFADDILSRVQAARRATENTFEKFLSENAEKAKALRVDYDRNAALLLEFQHYVQSLYNFKAILWHSDWDYSHYYRVSLNRLKDIHELHHRQLPLAKLAGRTLVFGGFSGIDSHNNILLSPENVQSRWLQVLQSFHRDSDISTTLDLLESKVSRFLRDIEIHRRNDNHVPSTAYKDFLLRFLDNFEEFCAYQGSVEFAHHITDLKGIHLSIADPNQALIMLANGHIVAPCAVLPRHLLNFIQQNFTESFRRQAELSQQRSRLQKVVQEFESNTSVKIVAWDNSIDLKVIVACVKELQKKFMQLRSNNRNLHDGLRIKIMRYYTLDSDGIMCIPIDWKASIDESFV